MPLVGLDQARRFLVGAGHPVARGIVREKAKAVLGEIIERTPIDLGPLRANWQVGLNTIPQSLVPGADPDGAATYSAGADIIDKAEFGDTINIANSLEYAHVIELGGYLPPNPSNEEGAQRNRRSWRTPAQRARAVTLAGGEGATVVRDGYALQAPQGMITVAAEKLRAGVL